MKFQFTTASLLLATAFSAIWIGGITVFWNIAEERDVEVHFWTRGLMCYSPIWVPLVFIAYVMGRRKFSVPVILSFAAVEATAIGAVIWLYHHPWIPTP